MRIDNNSLELDDIISDLHSVNNVDSESFAKPGVTAAVKTTTSSRP